MNSKAFFPYILKRSIPFLLIPFLTACGGDNEKKKDEGLEEEDQRRMKEERSRKRTYQQIPTPDRILSIIAGFDKKPDPEHLLDPDQTEDLMGKSEQGVHLGIYSTDLAYASVFGMGEEAMTYFRTVRRLADEVGISSAFDKETLEKFEASIRSGDSLQNISRETYLDAFEYLEKNDRGETLALMVGGGWTESLYLSVRMVDEYDSSDPMVQYIADQYHSLKQLQDFLKKYEDREEVAALLEDLQAVDEAYSALEQKKKGKSRMEKEDGKMVLSGGSRIEMSEEDFARIEEAVTELRERLTKKGEQGNAPS